jgi:hypothetical protein
MREGMSDTTHNEEVIQRLERIESALGESRLERIESILATLVERQAVKDWYSTDEVARLTGKAEFTVREWCRLGRIRAEKRVSGRGAYPAWVVSHQELLRYQRDGLLPIRKLG